MIVLLLAIFSVLMASNQEIRKNVIQAFNGEIQNAEENEKVEAYADGSALLSDDPAIITSASVVSRKTGTGPFDENDEPGNDSSETNDIVRSFDTVSWTIEATMDLKEGEGVDSITGGKINIEATLPEECANVMEWDVESMQWLEGSGVVSEDGRTLTGRYTMGEETTTIPGKQNLELILQVYGAKNGTNIQPKIKMWLDGNTEEEKRTVEIETVTVSATEKYNVELQRNTNLQKEIDVEMDEGTVRGRVYGYSLVYQLYNDEGVEKGLKGVQYPESNTMTLDVNLKLEKINANDASDVQDITETSTPILYNYDLNNHSNTEGNIPNRPMNIKENSMCNYKVVGGIGESDKSCYNSGNVTMNQNTSEIQVTISDYQFNGKFPKHSLGSEPSSPIMYEENIGCFSSIYFMIFVPYTEESIEEGYNYYLTVEDNSLQEVNSEDETKEIEQKITNDDVVKYQHKLSQEGKFSENHWLQNSWWQEGGNYLATHYTQGDAKAEKEQRIVYQVEIETNGNNDLKDDIYDANVLMKFDGEAFDISEIDGEIWKDNYQISNYSNTKMEFNMIYAAKPDGTNWTDDAEMQAAVEEDLKFYTSLEVLKEDLGENAICIGVLFESIDGYLSYGVRQCLEVALQVTDKAEVGNVYQFVSVVRLYKEDNELDRTTQTRANPDAVFPEADVEMHRNYVKSQYDENGQIMTGTPTGYSYGQSLLIVGGNLTVDYSVSDTTNDGNTKTNYDLGRGENTVGYTIKPQLTSNVVEGAIKESNVTVTVKDSLPKGLTYVPGSSDYEEPEIIENGDGSTTLVWEIYNCTVGEEIREINFKAKIDENTANSTQYESTIIVSADKIGTYVPSTRTDSTTIQITNLSSHRLYKETETGIAEANGELTYKITYQNNTDTSVPDFQILDILPYNGDGRGTAYTGTYTLKNVNVRQTGADGEIPTDNLSLYTTTNIDARKITPKDESIGVSEIWQEKEIGAEIGEAVTVLALKGEIGNNTNIEIEIILKATNNRSGDVYYNQATAQTSKDTDIITSTSAKSEIVSRQISGMVWYDTNENGVKDTEESYANRIEVELLKADGSKAVDYNGNEILNVLTNSNGEYNFSNLPMGEYIVEIQTEDRYTLTEANVGSNKEINSKFEEGEEGKKQSYIITNLNSIASPEIIEANVNAGLVVKDAKIIVKYLEEDNTPETDEDNIELKEQQEITTYEKDGEQVKYKIGDNYTTQEEQIEDYITLRNSENTSGTLNAEQTVVTYYYTYNKQNIEVTKVWKDNNNQAGKRPTSIKITLNDGNNIKENIVSEANKLVENENIWTTVFEEVPIYRENGEKINYTIDESENVIDGGEDQGNLESYIKTIEGMTITNTFTQNTEKIKIPVTKTWNDNNNRAGKRPENLTLILKREVSDTSSSDSSSNSNKEKTFVEVSRQTINGIDNAGENVNEWKYTFENIAKYDENNNEINYVIEEIIPEFYTSNVEKVENTGAEDTIEFKIINTFEVKNETTNIEVTKIWNDNNNRAGKRPESVTLKLSGDGKEYKAILTKDNKTVENENIWKATIADLPKYDENADIINYEIAEESLNNIFYTEENTTIDQQTKTVTNKFEVPNDKIEIEVSKKWEDNNNELQKRPEEVTLYLTGNNQEYEITLNESNKKADDENTWSGKIGNLPKYNVNGDEIIYTLDERPISSEFYTKTGIDQESKIVTNKFGIPTENIQIPVTKIWKDNNNLKGQRPENIVLQIKEKETGEVVSEQLVQGNNTTDEGWSYIFEVPKYNEEGKEIEYEIGERELQNKFYPTEVVQIDQENRTITNVFKVPDEKIELKVNKTWVDNDIQKNRRPEKIIINVKAENADNNDPEEIIDTYELNVETETSHIFTNLQKYNSQGDEIQYTVEEQEKNPGDLKFYTSKVSGNTTDGYVITNTFKRPEDTIDIIANKVWNDNEEQSAKRPESVTLVIKNGNEEKQSKVVTADSLVQGTTNKWSVEFTGLDKYDENGSEIQYTLEEKETKSGDLHFYQAEENNVKVEDNQATIRNKFVKPNDTTSVKVTKVWNDSNNANGKRPESITLKVSGNGQEYKKTITEAEGWTHTFTDLPKYDDNGKEIIYIASEEETKAEDLKFYTNKGTTGDMSTGYTIENIFTVPEEKIELKVNKVWQDNNIQNARRPSVITINVLGENKEVVQTYDLDVAGGEESHTFIGLDKYNSKGQEINYKVEEKEKNIGDLHFYTTVIGEITDAGEGIKQVTITNKFVKPDDVTNVTVTKIWEDNNNETGKRPSSIKLLLKNGSETVKEQEVNASNEVNENVNSWSYTFTGVSKYDENGQEIKYTVDETEIKSNDLQFYNKSINGLTVTNTFTQNTDKVEVPVTIIWLDNEVQAQRRPESVIIILKANGVEKQRFEISSSDKIDENAWQHTFTELPKYDENNNIINYTVDEEEVNSGELSFYMKSIEGTTITNTFTRPEDTISLTVNKVWEDQENKYNKRPKSIKVNVKDSKGIVQTAVITKDQNWEHTFTNLAKYDNDGREINYTVDEEEVLENDLFYYTKEIGNVNNISEEEKEVTITNEMTRIPSTVVVKYVDKNTGNEISEEKVKEGIIGDTFDVTEDVKEIPGYTLIEEPAEKTGTYTLEEQEKIYYYAKNTSVLVKYLEKDDTPNDDSNNKVLKDEILISGYEGKSYTTNSEVVDGYTLVETKGNTKGEMTREQQVVVYYYSKNTKVIVKYLEKDNTPAEISDNNVLLPEKTIEGYVGKEYKTTGETIQGYTLVEQTENTEGVMTEDIIEVIYYYAKNTSVIVKYLEKDTNIKLNNETLIEGYEGKDYKTEKKNIENYTFVEDTGNTSGKMSKEQIEVIYYYAQNTKATVQHIDRETGEILKEETQKGKVGDIFKTHPEDIDEYVLVESPEVAEIVMDKTGEQIVKYYYAHVSAGVLEKHIDIITGELLDSKEHEGNEGDKYKIDAKEFSGYDIVNTMIPSNAEGTMKRDEVIEVKYYYIKKATVIVKYVDEKTGEEISKEERIEGHENDKYTTESKNIEGYNLIRVPENKNGEMKVTYNEDGTYNTETEVIYYYKKIAGGVIENHIDVHTGKKLATEKHEGNIEDEYSIPAREFEGYDLVKDMLPDNAVGKMTEEEIEVNYYYEKITTVRVEYIDKITGEKLYEEKLKGHEGDEYTTEEKNFDGYDLIEKPSNGSGKMTEEEIVVKYYYQRKAEVEVKYLEKGTEYEVKEGEIIKGHVGDAYEIEQKEIPYYKFVEKTENWKGEMTKDKITVIYYYEKEIFNFRVDEWVGSVKINGISTPAQNINSSNEIYKVDINRKKADTAEIKITYKIRITNIGEIEGSIGKTIDIIPANCSFYQEDNDIHWVYNNGALTTDELASEVIMPGEYKEIEVTLRVNPGEGRFRQKDNMVIITELNNPAGYEDVDKEDNRDTSSMLLTIATGLDRNDRIIIIASIQILMLIAVGILFRKKAKRNNK